MNDIYRRAVERYGAERQLRKFQEECCEAAAAVAHHLERKDLDTRLALIEEAADVEISASYVRALFGDDDVDTAKARKLARLAARLDEEER